MRVVSEALQDEGRRLGLQRALERSQITEGDLDAVRQQGLEGAPANGPGRLRTGLVGGIFATLVGPLPRIGGRRRGRVKAPPAFVPGGDLPRDEVVARFRTHQAELLELVEACRHRDVDGVEIQSPFSDSFRFTFFATLVILGQHQHRHLQQAEEAAEVAS